jgi:hypothetical protein
MLLQALKRPNSITTSKYTTNPSQAKPSEISKPKNKSEITHSDYPYHQLPPPVIRKSPQWNFMSTLKERKINDDIHKAHRPDPPH